MRDQLSKTQKVLEYLPNDIQEASVVESDEELFHDISKKSNKTKKKLQIKFYFSYYVLFFDDILIIKSKFFAI